MSDATSSLSRRPRRDPVDIETAIALIETGDASEDIEVDLGDGAIARADGIKGLAGLLQRLRGLQQLMRLAETPGGGGTARMRGTISPVREDVEEILDALRRAR